MLPVDFSPAAEHGAELGPPLAETVWIEPYPSGPEASYEQREALELALIAAVQRLPPGQRAVLLLREVLGFSAAEVAEAIETSVPAVNSSLQRARRALEERLPRQSQQTTLRALGDATVRAVVGGYMDAWQRGDMDAVVAMLAEDAILAMPPTDTWFRGREAIGDFYRRYPGQTTWRHVETSANGQLAVGCYGFIDGAYTPLVIDVLTLGRGRADQRGHGLPRAAGLGGVRAPRDLSLQRRVERALEVLVHAERLRRHEREELGVDRAGDAGGAVDPEVRVEQARPGAAVRPPHARHVLGVQQQPVAPLPARAGVEVARRGGVGGRDRGREVEVADLVA